MKDQNILEEKKNDMTKKNMLTRIRLLPFSISMLGFIAGAYSGAKSVGGTIIFVICLILDIILIFFCSSMLLFFVVEENLK